MAHFAELDDTNKVLRVIVVNNEDITIDGVEVESKGIQFCQSLFGENTKWIQTSYNRKFRKNFACIDYIYDPINDHFRPQQPFPSWVLNDNALWDAPISYPTDGKIYIWAEETQAWVEIVIPQEQQ